MRACVSGGVRVAVLDGDHDRLSSASDCSRPARTGHRRRPTAARARSARRGSSGSAGFRSPSAGVVEEVLQLDHRQRVGGVAGRHDPRDVLRSGAQRSDLRLDGVLQRTTARRATRARRAPRTSSAASSAVGDPSTAPRCGMVGGPGRRAGGAPRDRGAQDADLLDELALDEPLARLETVLDDRLAQQVEDLLPQGRGDPLDAERQPFVLGSADADGGLRHGANLADRCHTINHRRASSMHLAIVV